jgi:hypothetical protein
MEELQKQIDELQSTVSFLQNEHENNKIRIEALEEKFRDKLGL